ncbi:MAG: response regulator [Sporolactobacillus sp.]|jgi:two-component system sensor histidine kinase/response regulator|nr:response regulator [Sporolactobacillus sp.]
MSVSAEQLTKTSDTILIVDDSPSDIINLTTLLKPLNTMIQVATNAPKALGILNKHIPTLILLDVYMQGIDGFQLCREIKQSKKLKVIPIIFITAANDENSIINGFKYGGQDYITKPYNADELVARVKSQLKIAQQSRKLSQAYKELEYFSYSASHELKSPILIINQLIHILKEQQLSEKDKTELFEHLDEKCKQSTMMIDGLLKFSRTFQHKLKIDKIDVGKICRQLINEFTQLDTTRKYQVTIDRQSHFIWIDETLFTILIQNILSNAFKFTKNRSITQINISFKKKSQYFIIEIRDNGIGFDKNYKGKIFTMFSRLHPFSEYHGNGIGLATVKRIMDRINGKIKIESIIDRGTKVSLFFKNDNGSNIGCL